MAVDLGRTSGLQKATCSKNPFITTAFAYI